MIYPRKRLLIFRDGAGWYRGSKVQEFIKDIDQTTNKFVDYLNNTNFNYSLLGFSPRPDLKM